MFKEVFTESKNPPELVKEIENYFNKNFKKYDVTITHEPTPKAWAQTILKFNNGNELKDIPKIVKKIQSEFSIQPYYITNLSSSISIPWKIKKGS